MPEFDIVAFVAKLDGMGVKLTAVPLADGTLRVNRWRMMGAAEHAQQIQDLWTSQIGDSQARVDLLAAHLSRVAPSTSVPSKMASRLRAASAAAGLPKAK